MKNLLLYLISIFCFPLFVGCATAIVAHPDPVVPPSSVSVYSMEIEACGHLAVGTAACVFTRGAEPEGHIRFRIPRTNTSNIPAEISLTSSACDVNRVYSGVPGQWIDISVVGLIGIAPVAQSCSFEMVMKLSWDKQDNSIVPVYPMLGRILILVLSHDPANIKDNQPFPIPGFASYVEVPGYTSPNSGQITIDSGGSSLGQIVYAGCGLKPDVQTFAAPNPAFQVPRVSSSCVMFAAMQRLDKSEPLSFALMISLASSEYRSLTPPVLTPGSLEHGHSASYVSAVDLDSMVVPGGEFTVPANLAKGEYDLRQITANGRFSISHIKGGQVEWTLP